ncbi:MAG TPA: hypothetical protein VFP12_03565 [Allosphingosinicella sp.]|nr:hypothetical protein [Allosphingosinicella sp.]
MGRVLKWILFALACLVSWGWALFELLAMGWSPCEQAGSCQREGIVVAIVLLLLPTQVAVAAYMRHREKEQDGLR